MPTDERKRDLIEVIARLPVIQALRQRYEFSAKMVVVTHGTIDFVTARGYVLSDQMCGRVRPEANKRDDSVRWFYELEQDSILFAIKFGTSLPRRLEQRRDGPHPTSHP